LLAICNDQSLNDFNRSRIIKAFMCLGGWKFCYEVLGWKRITPAAISS